MDNSPRLPIVSLLLAVALGGATLASYLIRDDEGIANLSELEIGMAAIGFTLGIFGIQGLISVLLEGRRLHPGIVPPRLTDPLSLAIVVFSVVLLGVSIWLGFGIVSDWSPIILGAAAGTGCIVLAMLLVFYKEAFVGDEACFDQREDGVPW